jgi:GT2 family glycosyltransferase
LFHETADGQVSGVTCERKILTNALRREGNPSIVSELPTGVLRVDWPVPANATVSVIIPTKDSPELLKNCIDSIRLRTVGPLPEIIVADNGSVRAETKALFDEIVRQGLAKVVPCPGPFNFSKINNQARRHATGDVIVLLNDDTQVISPDWLIELASLALRPEVGAVGSMLLYPDGTVQHGGILLGIGGGIADHAFRYLPGDSRGYLDLLCCRREVSAVTGACLAVSARNFDLLGGLDETLRVTLNDVDFCLRLRDRGLINIWTPWAVLEHWESKSRGIDHTQAALDRQAGEVRIFSERWGNIMARDPNYHPGLSDSAPDYHLAI